MHTMTWTEDKSANTSYSWVIQLSGMCFPSVTWWYGILGLHYSPTKPTACSFFCKKQNCLTDGRYNYSLLQAPIAGSLQQQGQQLSRSTEMLKTQLHFTYNMMRVRRFEQQDDGWGVVVEAKCKKHPIQNFLDANKELENFNHYFHSQYKTTARHIPNWSTVGKCWEWPLFALQTRFWWLIAIS